MQCCLSEYPLVPVPCGRVNTCCLIGPLLECCAVLTWFPNWYAYDFAMMDSAGISPLCRNLHILSESEGLLEMLKCSLQYDESFIVGP